jgi:hypothetical protein
MLDSLSCSFTSISFVIKNVSVNQLQMYIYFCIRTDVKVTSITVCPPGPPDATSLALGVSGAIFIVGLLLLLIWKILTSLLDEMEYKKFSTEINDPKWGFVSLSYKQICTG